MTRLKTQVEAEIAHEADGATLFDDVHAYLNRFVIYPSSGAHVAHTLWVAHTHLMDCWESTPRIAFLSPEPASGKTRALETTETLVPVAILAVNVTPAYLFRRVSSPEGLPTILHDEIDTVFGARAKDSEDVRAILNGGHRRGATAGRCVVRGNTIETEELPSYCAVALAGLGNLPDTILSRSVIIRMRRRAPTEHIEPYRRRVHAPEGHALQERLAAWAVRVEPSVKIPEDLPEGVEDRDADVWEALFAVADTAGGKWPERARVAAVALVTAAKESIPSLGIQLLTDLRKVFGEQERMFTEKILEELIKLDEAPWGDLRGRPLDSRRLAKYLRPYGIKPRDVRICGMVLRGYTREDLWDAWTRYL